MFFHPHRKTHFFFYLFISFILLFSMSVFAQELVFTQEEVTAGFVYNPSFVYCADIDGDGDNDVLSASKDDNKIAWYENTDGLGNFGHQQVISTNAICANSIFCADLDGDGDLDVLSASYSDNKIAWYENTDGYGTFGPQIIITEEAIEAMAVFAADLDGDNDYDVLSASCEDDKIAWYENTDGLGTFSEQQLISDDAVGANDVFSVDIDGDGDNDVISSPSGWYENLDGSGDFGDRQIIYENLNYPNDIYCEDINGDGYYDVLAATKFDYKINWYENTGSGDFTDHYTVDEGAAAISVNSVDIDGDGDCDIVAGLEYSDQIVWYENLDGSGYYGCQRTITTSIYGETSVCASDIDGDGDNDVISASSLDNKIAWYENTDGSGNFSEQIFITSYEYQVGQVISKDLDSDGDNDIIAVSKYENKISWYENLNGLGDFSRQQVIAEEVDTPFICSGDLDSDNDLDILVAIGREDLIFWYENIDGNAIFGPRQIVSTGCEHYRRVNCIDMDGDGDNDILALSTEYMNCKITWFENTDGVGSFSDGLIISADTMGIRDAIAGDPDGDNDIDIISATARRGDGFINWYENVDGQCNFAPKQILAENELGAWFLLNPDVNGDGLSDIIAAFWDKLYLYRNESIVSIEEKIVSHNLPDTHKILSVFPNPFNPETTIKYYLQKPDLVHLYVFNIYGQQVTELVDGYHQAGEYTCEFNGSEFASSIYFVQLKVGNIVDSRKLLMVK